MRENFKPAGEVAFAAFASSPPLFTKTTTTAALNKVQKSGLQYEKRAQEYLRRLCELREGIDCVCNPWVIFRRVDDHPSSVNFCQPDCLLVSDSKVIIVECKLSHTGDSYRQLRQLYEPVVRRIYPNREIALLEVCKWFDPHTKFPETFYYAETPLDAEVNRLGIHIYKPRGRIQIR